MNDQTKPVNINTAKREELLTLPGVGPALADRILESRPFTSIEELQRVSGIGSSLLENMQAMITLNDSSSQTSTTEEASPPEVASAEMEAPASTLEAGQEPPEEVQLPVTEEYTEAQPEISPAEEEAPVPEPESGEAVDESTISEEQPPGPQAEFAPPPAQQAAPAEQPRFVTRGQALWMALGASFLSLVLALVISLGVLAALNGGLQYVNPADLNALGRKVDGVTTQTQTLQQDLDGLRTRVNNLEGLSGRMGNVENQAKQLRTDLDNTSQQMGQINQQMTQISSDIKDLQSQTGRFQGFLDGLQSLLNQVSQP
jgi:competence ComEA-like helix-hairpin-helix protein